MQRGECADDVDRIAQRADGSSGARELARDRSPHFRHRRGEGCADDGRRPADEPPRCTTRPESCDAAPEGTVDRQKTGARARGNARGDVRQLRGDDGQARRQQQPGLCAPSDPAACDVRWHDPCWRARHAGSESGCRYRDSSTGNGERGACRRRDKVSTASGARDSSSAPTGCCRSSVTNPSRRPRTATRTRNRVCRSR